MINLLCIILSAAFWTPAMGCTTGQAPAFINANPVRPDVPPVMPGPKHRRPSLLSYSLGAFEVAQAADIGTSLYLSRQQGYYEANALYGRHFGGQAAGIKAGFAIAVPLIERHLIGRHPRLERPLAAFNLAAAGATGPAIAQNARLIY